MPTERTIIFDPKTGKVIDTKVKISDAQIAEAARIVTNHGPKVGDIKKQVEKHNEDTGRAFDGINPDRDE